MMIFSEMGCHYTHRYICFSFGNFRVAFILQIWKVLNSQMCDFVVFMVYKDSLLARTLNSRGVKFGNIREN